MNVEADVPVGEESLFEGGLKFFLLNLGKRFQLLVLSGEVVPMRSNLIPVPVEFLAHVLVFLV